MLVAISALVPRVIVVPAIMLVVPIAVPRLGDDAAGSNRDQCEKKTAVGDAFFDFHIRSCRE